MDLSVFLGGFLKAFEMLIPFLYWFLPLLVVSIVIKSAWFKGHVGEWFVNKMLSYHFKLPDYSLYKDVMLATDEGSTQIDHILVSPYGIFVIETKNMNGWIFGSEKQAKWTQQIYKHKSSFQNPLRQNYKHTKVIQDLLDLDDSSIHSLVVFVGGSEFKTKMPSNVVRAAAMKKYIVRFQKTLIDSATLQRIKDQLEKVSIDKTIKNKRAHVKHVKSLVNDKKTDNKSISATTKSNADCPKCESKLKLRIATKGSHKGTKFYGCSSFPKCRYTKKAA